MVSTRWRTAISNIFLRALDDVNKLYVYFRLFYSKYTQYPKEIVAQRAPYGCDGPGRSCYIGKEDGEVMGSHDMGGKTTQRDPSEGG